MAPLPVMMFPGPHSQAGAAAAGQCQPTQTVAASRQQTTVLEVREKFNEETHMKLKRTKSIP